MRLLLLQWFPNGEALLIIDGQRELGHTDLIHKKNKRKERKKGKLKLAYAMKY